MLEESPKPLLERRAILIALLAVRMCIFAGGSVFGQDSFIVTQTETSDPPDLFPTLVTRTNYPPGSAVIILQTQTAPTEVNGYRFTHWTLNGQRVEDFTDQSINPAPTPFTN